MLWTGQGATFDSIGRCAFSIRDGTPTARLAFPYVRPGCILLPKPPVTGRINLARSRMAAPFSWGGRMFISPVQAASGPSSILQSHQRPFWANGGPITVYRPLGNLANAIFSSASRLRASVKPWPYRSVFGLWPMSISFSSVSMSASRKRSL